MIKFLDALYISSCNFYKKREAGMFKISGLILLTLVFLSNVILISLILPRYFDNISSSKIYNERYIIIGITMPIVMILLYLRYFKITSYDEVRAKLENISDRSRVAFYLVSVIYIIISIFGMIGYAAYLGYSK